MLGSVLYIHFTPQWVTVRNLKTGQEQGDEPLVALYDKRVMAIGRLARTASEKVAGTILINPFDDPSRPVRDNDVAIALLNHLIRQALPKLTILMPVVFLQYRGEAPIGVEENHDLQRIVASLGARKSIILSEKQRFSDAELLNPALLKKLG